MNMRRERKAKIVATLGHPSSNPDAIRKLFDAGADVLRLDFSHGANNEHQQRYQAISREARRHAT
jgi:pyruvate kinase